MGEIYIVKISKLIIGIFLILIITISANQVSAKTVIGDDITTDGNITSLDSILAPYLKATFGFKDMNRSVWQLKLNYSAELANKILLEQERIAISFIETAKKESLTRKGEPLYDREQRLIGARDTALDLIISNKVIANAIILEAKQLALLNSATQSNLEGIITEVQIQSDILNATALSEAQIVYDVYNESMVQIIANHSKLATVNFTLDTISTSSGTIYTEFISIPLYPPNPTLIKCEIISNASATNVGVQYWSNITNSSKVNQFVEYYDAINSIESEWTTNSNFNILPTGSSRAQLHITHINIYTNQSIEGKYTLSFKSEVGASLVAIRPPSFCEKKEY